ncbi:MAG: hypothetical protein VB081_09995 [Christensenella sp.]|uniref:hypothetical protein n=1 Tax=Christensenella sp. TaxID=1935934 RepID=UPI002B2011F8|nr:hypothetical protein [Christensenella sp.]MEA5003817.1 hypothetical protein [Christensenella sp.]
MSKQYMENQDIRNQIEKAGLTIWQVFRRMGKSQATSSRWMREKLTGEKRLLVVNAIKELKNKKGE